MLDRTDYFGHDKRRGIQIERASELWTRRGAAVKTRDEEPGRTWRADSWSVGPVLRREACSSEREEVLLLRQSLRGPRRAAKRDAETRTRCIHNSVSFHRHTFVIVALSRGVSFVQTRMQRNHAYRQLETDSLLSFLSSTTSSRMHSRNAPLFPFFSSLYFSLEHGAAVTARIALIDVSGIVNVFLHAALHRGLR